MRGWLRIVYPFPTNMINLKYWVIYMVPALFWNVAYQFGPKRYYIRLDSFWHLAAWRPSMRSRHPPNASQAHTAEAECLPWLPSEPGSSGPCHGRATCCHSCTTRSELTSQNGSFPAFWRPTSDRTPARIWVLGSTWKHSLHVEPTLFHWCWRDKTRHTWPLASQPCTTVNSHLHIAQQ